MGVMIERDPLEDSDPSKGGGDARKVPGPEDLAMGEVGGFGVLPGEDESEFDEGEGMLGVPPSEKQVLRFIQEAEPKANEFFQEKAMDKVLAVYRAARNEHPAKSKYNSPLYKNRASYHRPKTRNAIRRVQTAAANALFGARDVIDISPGDESNPTHRAAAALRKEVVNYRLSRSSGRNAIPWFEVSIGGRTDAYQTGYTVSLQTWQYRERITGKEPILDALGQPIETMNGPVMKNASEILIDRPDITLYPIENVGIDPAAPWQDPAQNAAFIYLKDAVYVNDQKAVMQQGMNRSNIPWREAEDVDWSSGRVDPNQDARSVRTGRADGQTDRFDDLSGTVEHEDGNKLVWRYLWFFRWNGEDYCVYTIGTRTLLSDPIRTADAYPALGGARPVVVGTDVIAPHDLLPMSNAAALQPMQQEINDQTNLRIDAIRQSVFPIAKIKRGRNIDAVALTKRGANTNIMVEDQDDFAFETIPNGAASLFQEMDRLNNDFDESAGIFSNSSVQGQRAMNETVGGMKILAGDAQAVANLELRVWTETWVERVISQISLLCSYYETDARILSICGDRAQLAQRFGIDLITDDLLLAEAQCVVDVGTGSHDPNEAISRFSMAWQTVMPLIQNDLATGRVKIKSKEVFNEVFGHAQYKDAGDRFIEVTEEEPVSPEQMQQLQQQLDEANARVQELEVGKEAQKEVAKIKADSDMQLQLSDQQHEKQMLILESQAQTVQTLLGGGIAAGADKRKGQMAEAADQRKGDMALESDKRQLTVSERNAKREDARAAQQQLMAMAGQGGDPMAGGMPPEAGAPPGGDPMGGPGNMLEQMMTGMMGQVMQGMQAMMGQLQQQLAAQQQAQTDMIVQALTAEQVITRGPDGKVTGAKRQLPNMTRN